MDKLQKWRDALTEAANLSGWDSIACRPESKLIKRTVEDILLKLNRMSTSALLFPDLVGMAKHVVQIESLLPIDSSNVRNVGIWAMGGIGKTTIAGCVFAKLPSQFERCCFVANVREEVENFGSNHLRDKYLTDLLEQHNLHVGTPSVGSTFVKTRLSRKTVILVFDDVENSSQLEYLLGSGDSSLGLGSRLMVTSRDRQVLVKAADEIYEVPEMSFEESLQLFCLNAFKMDNPVENLRELSNMLVYHYGGNPLALKVLGSCLYNRNKKEWESALKKLNKAPHKEIHNVLKLSYDGLDDEEKAVFLDISCFFNEHESMTNIVGILGEFAIISIRVLIDLCLVSFLHASERVDMHDLIKETSQEIVRQQSITERGKHSRLWCPKDIYHVLKNNMGTDAVECISLDMTQIKEVHLSAAAFAKMPNLRLLKFYDSGNCSSKVHISEGLEGFSNTFILIQWDGYPWRSLPFGFSPENLVDLILPNGHLKQLWDGVQNLPNLRYADLSYSEYLIEIPDLSQATNLKSVCLYRSRKLNKFPIMTSENIDVLDLRMTATEEVPSSISSLVKLSKLDLSYCESLENLTSSISKMKSLIDIRLDGCLRLKKFPEIMEPMENLREFTIDETAIEELPSSIEHLVGLETLDLRNCNELKCIPNNICNLNCLKWLCIFDCPKFVKFPTLCLP